MMNLLNRLRQFILAHDISPSITTGDKGVPCDKTCTSQNKGCAPRESEDVSFSLTQIEIGATDDPRVEKNILDLFSRVRNLFLQNHDTKVRLGLLTSVIRALEEKINAIENAKK